MKKQIVLAVLFMMAGSIFADIAFCPIENADVSPYADKFTDHIGDMLLDSFFEKGRIVTTAPLRRSFGMPEVSVLLDDFSIAPRYLVAVYCVYQSAVAGKDEPVSLESVVWQIVKPHTNTVLYSQTILASAFSQRGLRLKVEAIGKEIGKKAVSIVLHDTVQ